MTKTATFNKTLILLLGVVLFIGCAPSRPKGIKDCEFRLADTRVTETAATYLKMEMLLDVTNPNGLDVVIDHVQYKVYASGYKVGSGARFFDTTIPAGESKKLKSTVSIDYFEAGMAVITLIKGGSANYRMSAKVYYRTPLGDFSSNQEILEIHAP